MLGLGLGDIFDLVHFSSTKLLRHSLKVCLVNDVTLCSLSYDKCTLSYH